MDQIPRTAILVALLAACAAADDVPRYQLEPGTVLTYRGEMKFKYEGGAYCEQLETTAWVARRNPDGSARIVARQGSRIVTSFSEESLAKALAKPDATPMDYDLAYFDIFPDGRIGDDADLGLQFDPAFPFPRLPDGAAREAWHLRDARMGRHYAYASLRAEPGGWTFRAEQDGTEKKVYGITLGSTYHFDAARGAVARIEQALSQDHGVKGRGAGATELTGLERKDAAWVAAFAPAAEHYFAAAEGYRRLAEAASKDAEKSLALRTEARGVLQAARDAIEHPIFREELDRRLKSHDDSAKDHAEAMERRAAVVGKPARDWSLQDLGGKPHALSDYRGKVVVLDFWYRNCAWCVKAMPQMNELTEQFRGKPVAVLGMNTDEKEEDARFVAEAMCLKYATLLHAGELPEKYGVRGFPTLILIGPDGVVRDVHSGYSPTLRVDMAEAIKGLMPPETAPKP